MSLARVQNFSISLDGFGTGEGQSHDAPFGHAGERLHGWMFATRWWRGPDEPGGSGGVDDVFAQQHDSGIGGGVERGSAKSTHLVRAGDLEFRVADQLAGPAAPATICASMTAARSVGGHAWRRSYLRGPLPILAPCHQGALRKPNCRSMSISGRRSLLARSTSPAGSISRTRSVWSRRVENGPGHPLRCVPPACRAVRSCRSRPPASAGTGCHTDTRVRRTTSMVPRSRPCRIGLPISGGGQCQTPTAMTRPQLVTSPMLC